MIRTRIKEGEGLNAAITAYIAENHGAFESQIANAVGRNRITVRYRLQSMCMTGILKTESDGYRTRYYLTEKAVEKI